MLMMMIMQSETGRCDGHCMYIRKKRRGELRGVFGDMQQIRGSVRAEEVFIVRARIARS